MWPLGRWCRQGHVWGPYRKRPTCTGQRCRSFRCRCSALIRLRPRPGTCPGFVHVIPARALDSLMLLCFILQVGTEEYRDLGRFHRLISFNGKAFVRADEWIVLVGCAYVGYIVTRENLVEYVAVRILRVKVAHQNFRQRWIAWLTISSGMSSISLKYR